MILLCVIVASTATGTYGIGAARVLGAVLGGASDDVAFVVRELRLPRALTGALAGAALGSSGGVFQSVIRNPLASPDIIGVTAGASVASVLTLVVADRPTAAHLAFSATAGAIAAAGAIYALAMRRRSATPYRLVLVGIGLAAALTSLTSFLLTRTDAHQAQRATLWLTGSLNARTWTDVRVAATGMAVLVPVVVLGTRPLRVLELGDDVARGLGAAVERARGLLLLAAVALAATATAVAGPVGFVALAAPQIARRIAGNGQPALTLSALAGATVVVAADLAGRTLFSPKELPVGVVTAAVGAPYLLWLLVRANHREAA